jgi:hypothetical protein
MPDFIRETRVWKDPACPVAVEYSAIALENIRRHAVDGLLSLPRVGLGVGGFLLGTRKAGKPLILDFHPIPCSHASGPSFAPTLGEIEWGKASALESAAASLEILGLYCSRPRIPLQVAQKDRDLFKCLCPGAGQIALLIRPSTTDVSLAALFYRKADGTLAGGTPLPLEEIVVPEEADQARDIVNDTFSPPAVEPVAIPSDPAAPLFGDPEPFSLPSFAAAPLPRGLHWPAVAAPLLVVGILIAMFSTREQWLPRPPLDLRTAETNGNFAVEWNRAAVRGVDRALLTVNDGGATKKIQLDTSQLQAGAIPYSRQTPEVTATLDAGGIHASAKFVAPPPPLAAAPTVGLQPVPTASQTSHP